MRELLAVILLTLGAGLCALAGVLAFRLYQPWQGRHVRRESTPQEPPSPHPGRACGPGCDVTNAAHGHGGLWGADADPAAAGTPVPVRVLPAPDHVGATGEWGAVLHAIRADMAAEDAEGTAALDPDERRWQAEVSATRARLAEQVTEFDRAMTAVYQRLVGLDETAQWDTGELYRLLDAEEVSSHV